MILRRIVAFLLGMTLMWGVIGTQAAWKAKPPPTSMVSTSHECPLCSPRNPGFTKDVHDDLKLEHTGE